MGRRRERRRSEGPCEGPSRQPAPHGPVERRSDEGQGQGARDEQESAQARSPEGPGPSGRAQRDTRWSMKARVFTLPFHPARGFDSSEADAFFEDHEALSVTDHVLHHAGAPARPPNGSVARNPLPGGRAIDYGFASRRTSRLLVVSMLHLLPGGSDRRIGGAPDACRRPAPHSEQSAARESRESGGQPPSPLMSTPRPCPYNTRTTSDCQAVPSAASRCPGGHAQPPVIIAKR